MTAVVGTLGDGGQTARRLREEQGFSRGSLDFVFVDHDKDAYLPDLHLILREGWLRPGAIVVADNVKFPGAPEYRAYMKEHEGTTLAHDGARRARRVPDDDQGSRAGVGAGRVGDLGLFPAAESGAKHLA